MSANIVKFIEKLKGFEARGSRDFTMSLNDAKDLHADITKLLLRIEDLQTIVVSQQSTKEEITEIQLNGGTFK
jgi:hypothetical protein